MKKTFVAILALTLLCSSASADTIREQTGAPQRATGEWYSNTGHTRVTVDAAVIVPEVESISTYAVSGRDVTAQDAKNMALAAAPGTDWERDWVRVKPSSFERWPGGRDEPNEVIDSSRGSRFFNYGYDWFPFSDGSPDYMPASEWLSAQHDPYASVGSYNWHMTTPFGEKRLIAQTDYAYQSGDGTAHFPVNMLWIDGLDLPEDAALPGQSLTLAQARAMAEAFAVAIQPDFRLERAAKVQDDDETGMYAYWFSFTRTTGGVPVTRTNTSSLEDEDEVRNQSYESAPKCETLTCVIDQGRILNAQLMNPWEIGERMRENVSLLPFDEILNIFGAISPLSIQSQERDPEAMQLTYDNTWQINEIRLGYMPVLVKDGSGTWELRPVWDFFGIHTFSATYNDSPGNVALTIDAISGLVIDRNYGY
ncbi:MAG: hypothetical protein J1E43_03990 [Christensenellaceae bacterium]|nr:hypothetical protein [Christensenellaceae bacterium]